MGALAIGLALALAPRFACGVGCAIWPSACWSQCAACLCGPDATHPLTGDGLHHVRTDDLGWWLAERQTPGGGLNGRPEKLPDVCYSWWILSALAIMRRLSWIDRTLLARFCHETLFAPPVCGSCLKSGAQLVARVLHGPAFPHGL